MAIRKSKPDPNAVYVALVGFTGEQFAVNEGARLKGSDEIVRRFTHLFIHDGATSAEVGIARNALAGEPPAPQSERTFLTPGPLTPSSPGARVVEQDGSFVLADGSHWYLNAGDLVDERDPRVAAALANGLRLKQPEPSA